jgi:hypothetical protein
MAFPDLIITPVSGKTDLKAFVEFAYEINADDPNWVPPLRNDVYGMITPGKNPFFEHAEAQYFLARRRNQISGRISAHIDRLALTIPVEQGMGPGTGNWGLLEARDEESAHALIRVAEDWLRARDMTRVLAPISLSIWEEPGLLVDGYDHPPMYMMGHHRREYKGWIESAGYAPAKTLYTYDLDVTQDFPPIVQRIVASGAKNPRIHVRRVDKSKFEAEAAIIMAILNDAWGTNWGFVPITDREIAFTGKKLKPLVFEELIRIAEVDGEPVAFMMTLPDLNEKLMGMGGSLWPFNLAKLLWWLRNPRGKGMRVPLMGVVKRLQASRLASQLAFMMIDMIRQDAIARFGTQRAEIGWILEDNQGMVAIADAIDSKINKTYRIYEKPL